MSLRITIPDGELDSPENHPHFNVDDAPTLLPDSDADEDETTYVFGLKGARETVAFFRWYLDSMIAEHFDTPEDVYTNAEQGAHGHLSIWGISEAHINEFIEVFNETATGLEEIQITGTFNGQKGGYTLWDGEVYSEDPLAAASNND